MPRAKKYGVDEVPKKKVTDEEIAKVIKGESQGLLSFLLKQWQFWAIIVVLILAIMLAAISGSSDDENVNAEYAEYNPVAVSENVEPEPIVQNPNSTQVILISSMNQVFEYIPTFTVLIVIVSIFGVGIKIFNKFKE